MSTELDALAEVIRMWLPGLKADPLTIAGVMQRNLLKRGVRLELCDTIIDETKCGEGCDPVSPTISKCGTCGTTWEAPVEDCPSCDV